jgi:hypothetical protein
VGEAPNLFAFVHIPRTGGTSFRFALEARFGRVYSAYGGEKSSPLVREVLGEQTTDPRRAGARLLRILLDEAASETPEPVFLCGHFRYRRYPLAELGVPVITFVRDPVERVVSNHRSGCRTRGEERPLRQFALEAPANVQSNFLAGVDLDELAFIGLTERFEESIRLFNRQTGFDIQALALNRTQPQGRKRAIRLGRPADRGISSEHLDPEIRELILSRNARDVELYRAARKLVDARLEEAVVGG